MTQRLAVIGGGWAGLAAAVAATRKGHQVTLFEMAPQLGGRSRAIHAHQHSLDNGQHILIGAYSATLALMKALGVNVDATCLRTPLRVAYPNGTGLLLQPGSPMVEFTRAVLRMRGWSLRERLALLFAASRWVLAGFRCDPQCSVATLTRGLPETVRRDLIEPLCVAALNTPTIDASASVFLRVLKDALFSGPGCADLLLPRVNLSELLPDPAERWLLRSGATIHVAHRVQAIERRPSGGWQVDGEVFDCVILAASATEASRLVTPLAPEWAKQAAALRYEPIVTVYLQSDGARLPEPMLALHATNDAPAQFVFDRGQLGGPVGLLAFVISGAATWVERGTTAIVDATLQQARDTLAAFLVGPLSTVQVVVEKRATFACSPGLIRPRNEIAPGLFAAGDFVDGPYPATLEGAVRSGEAAAARVA